MPVAETSIAREAWGCPCRREAFCRLSVVAHARWPPEVWKESPSPWDARLAGEARLKAIGTAVGPLHPLVPRSRLDRHPAGRHRIRECRVGRRCVVEHMD